MHVQCMYNYVCVLINYYNYKHVYGRSMVDSVVIRPWLYTACGLSGDQALHFHLHLGHLADAFIQRDLQ